MKTFLTLLIFAIAGTAGFCQPVQSSCEAPDSIKVIYEEDARWLAVRSMHLSPSLQGQVLIPETLVEQQFKYLLAVHNGAGLPARDTVVDCLGIHVDKTPFTLRDVSFTSDAGTVETWLSNFIAGTFPTGNADADTLISQYQLIVTSVSQISQSLLIDVIAGFDINTAALANKLSLLPGVEESIYELVFSNGSNGIVYEPPAIPIDTFIVAKYTYGWECELFSCPYYRTWVFHIPLNCEKLDFVESYGDPPDTLCQSPNAALEEDFLEIFEANPTLADDVIFVKIISRRTGSANLRLMNLQGQTLKSSSFQLSAGLEHQASFELSGLPGGPYFLLLSLDNHVFSKKILK
jgi:hypothetical protein